jgi:hypothetical protein
MSTGTTNTAANSANTPNASVATEIGKSVAVFTGPMFTKLEQTMASNQVELLALVHSLRQEFRDAHKEKENKRKTKTNADAADATAGGAAKDEPPAKTAAAFFKKCFVTDAEIRTKYGDAEIDANERKQGKNRKEEKILEAIASSCFKQDEAR